MEYNGGMPGAGVHILGTGAPDPYRVQALWETVSSRDKWSNERWDYITATTPLLPNGHSIHLSTKECSPNITPVTSESDLWWVDTTLRKKAGLRHFRSRSKLFSNCFQWENAWGQSSSHVILLCSTEHPALGWAQGRPFTSNCRLQINDGPVAKRFYRILNTSNSN